MNNSFKEENGEILVSDTWDFYKLEEMILPGTTPKVGTVKEVCPKTGDWVWLPRHNYFEEECWELVDEMFLELHSSASSLDNYRYVFLLKNQ